MEIKALLRLSSDCFGTGREQQLNLLRGPYRGLRQLMDVRFCRSRNHSREAPMRAKDLDQKVHALTSAPGHVCFSLTEDLHGCRTLGILRPPVLTRVLCADCVPVPQMIRHFNFTAHLPCDPSAKACYTDH